MSSNKHAQIRYKVLDDCFSNFRKQYYFEDLLDECNYALSDYGSDGIMTRTLRADISDMRKMCMKSGVEILALKNNAGDYYYRYSKKGFSIYNSGLNENDINQLKETISMLQRFKGAPSLDWVSEIIVKFQDKLNLRGASQSVVGYHENADYTGLDWFQEIFDAIINKSVLIINYRTFSETPYEWIVHPYYLKEYNNRWFLLGLNEEKQVILNIALDRIDDIDQIKKEYIPSTINFETYFDNIIGVTLPDGQIETIRLQFSEHRFPYVMTKPIHKSQHIVDIDKRIIEINVIPNKELESLILSYGNDVEVLAPAGFRDKIIGLIKESYEKYSSVQIDCTEHT